MLIGAGGHDVLYGGDGADTLTGNAGHDVFLLSKGNDVITDFQVKKDAIGFVNALEISIEQDGDDLLIIDSEAKVSTRLLGIDRDDFLSDYPNNLQQVPVAEVDVF